MTFPVYVLLKVYRSSKDNYNDVIMAAVASQITSLTFAYSTVDSYADQRKHQSPASLAFVCVGNSPGTGEFSAQMASNAENISIWWRYHENLCIITISHWVYSLDIYDALRVGWLQWFMIQLISPWTAWPPFWQTTFSNAFSRIKMIKVLFKC